jgi:hypothetical protein
VQPGYLSISILRDYLVTAPHSIWGNIVSSDSNDILFRSIFCRVECEACFPRKHIDKLLLRGEFPRQLLRFVCIEMNFDSTSVFYWSKAFRVKSTRPNFRSSSETRGGTKHSVQWNSSVAGTYCYDCLHD